MSIVYYYQNFMCFYSLFAVVKTGILPYYSISKFTTSDSQHSVSERTFKVFISSLYYSLVVVL